MFQSEFFDPKDTQLKWRLIMANSSHLPGHVPRTPAAPTLTAPAAPTSEPVQYEPAPININRQRNNENVRRKRLRDVFLKFDQTIKGQPEAKHGSENKTGHWIYPERSDQNES